MKTFECKLVHKVDQHIKIDFVQANNAIEACTTADNLNPDWICQSAELID